MKLNKMIGSLIKYLLFIKLILFININLFSSENIKQEALVNISKKLYQQQNNKEFCDYTIISADGIEFKVHKNILATNDYFYRMFKNPMLETINNKFKSLNSAHVLEAIIKFIYLPHEGKNIIMNDFKDDEVKSLNEFYHFIQMSFADTEENVYSKLIKARIERYHRKINNIELFEDKYFTFIKVAGSHDGEIRPFEIAKFETTQKHYKIIMGENPSIFRGESRPVEFVSLKEINEYIKRLNQDDLNYTYSLPTVKQLEHAISTNVPFMKYNTKCNKYEFEYEYEYDVERYFYEQELESNQNLPKCGSCDCEYGSNVSECMNCLKYCNKYNVYEISDSQKIRRGCLYDKIEICNIFEIIKKNKDFVISGIPYPVWSDFERFGKIWFQSLRCGSVSFRICRTRKP